KPNQQARYHQICWQLYGPPLRAEKDVRRLDAQFAKGLELKEDQEIKIAGIITTKGWPAARADVLEMLNDVQKDRFNDKLGKPFELPAPGGMAKETKPALNPQEQKEKKAADLLEQARLVLKDNPLLAR